MDEQQAIACLKRGDIGGLETLVREHQVRAVRAAFLIVQDRSLAEDIVQNAFVRVYERIAQFDATRPFGPWFLKSVINDSLKVVTRQKYHLSIERDMENDEMALAHLLADTAPGLAEMAEGAETRRLIRYALEKLTPAQRSAVLLRYYLDSDETEMIKTLRRPPGTVKWLLRAARERLRTLLHPLRPDTHPKP